MAKANKLSKIALTKEQGISRSSLYYQPKLEKKDWILKNQIEKTLKLNPSYGYRRIALALKVNHKRTFRVMKKYSIKPYRRRGRKWKKTKDNLRVYPNLLQLMDFPTKDNLVWVLDFSVFSFHGKLIYLATIMDIFNRKIVGWSLLNNHSVHLTLTALMNALDKCGRPMVLHSDQGSEYKSKLYTDFARRLGIKLSMSNRASPWENGYQESFYSQFKLDLGDINRCNSLGELAVAIYQQIYYYNNHRIHTKLKMPPAVYARKQTLLTNYMPIRV
ncbi:MAG: hypothetical protein COV55_05190 [Candidatus Komeilibacteria bacterium CG11_big_fil_rev_8_21_14_0_20_36_20]|uniref:Integrase catalytic domain-containing protein n=1 Tax=Candidatus Komeilibacteria bacterium CG11_big_fil_rev_8_21_14_0_20_36_20 TaxID=1974477 RepID=A0A2H0NB14_9BACT|nr:MAG: hypothetical protein COV55_05190 [Candidatus Komeilibacteria bacterium CG11_big_fil_rev_8_21_14_0_20_36_20]PIR82090.1 MAG: hypothetical protein COU21_00435 [Candidatus Komeilibacteria bacterium CG10_big_fil_rev_8_21_14_0_10_36_65]PJC55688.1 MAG: hypothetical protein CO027_00635 [Candidatus Komeilibacteria bacterium CG_4_9_14_0_2_um_filter_36_13]